MIMIKKIVCVKEKEACHWAPEFQFVFCCSSSQLVEVHCTAEQNSEQVSNVYHSRKSSYSIAIAYNV